MPSDRRADLDNRSAYGTAEQIDGMVDLNLRSVLHRGMLGQSAAASIHALMDAQPLTAAPAVRAGAAPARLDSTIEFDAVAFSYSPQRPAHEAAPATSQAPAVLDGGYQPTQERVLDQGEIAGAVRADASRGQYEVNGREDDREPQQHSGKQHGSNQHVSSNNRQRPLGATPLDGTREQV